MASSYQPLTYYSRATQTPVQQPIQQQVQQPPVYNPAPQQPAIPPANPVPQTVPYQPVGMTWVKGLQGANDYPIARGATLALFDQDEEKFYVKSIDMYTNQQTLRAFSYEEIPMEQLDGTVDMSKYVTIEKFNALQEELEELKSQQKGKTYFNKSGYKKKENDEQ